MLEADVFMNIYTFVTFRFFNDIGTFGGEDFIAHPRFIAIHWFLIVLDQTFSIHINV